MVDLSSALFLLQSNMPFQTRGFRYRKLYAGSGFKRGGKAAALDYVAAVMLLTIRSEWDRSVAELLRC